MPGLNVRLAPRNSAAPKRRPPTLPTELWDRVVSLLTPADKRNLGSTCRALNNRYWAPEKAMYRVPIADLEEEDLEWARWVFLESRSREALKNCLVMPDPCGPSFIPGEPGAYPYLTKLEFEVFLGASASQGFSSITFIRDVCSYHRVAPNLQELRVHVDVRARDLSLLHRGAGPKEDKDWTVSRRTSLLKDDVELPDQRTTIVIFHHLDSAAVREGSATAEQMNELLACLPASTVALVTAPLTSAMAKRAARGERVAEKLVTAFVPRLSCLWRVNDEALKSLTSLVLRQASPLCARNLVQHRFPRLTVVALPLSRGLFNRFLDRSDDRTRDDDVRTDMVATATHRGISRLLLTQDTPFAWHILYHLKLSRQVSISEETSLAEWPHDFVRSARGQSLDEAFPDDDDFALPRLESFDELRRREKRLAKAGGGKGVKRARRS